MTFIIQLEATQAADTANTIATSALIVAVIAAAFSLAAAIFTGWQAVTAHLARTRLPPAIWIFLPADNGEARLLRNDGGSPAHDVRVFVWGHPLSKRGRREAAAHFKTKKDHAPKLLGEPVTGARIKGTMAIGEAAPLEGVGPRREMFAPKQANRGSGVDILYTPALVLWTDYRGKKQAQWVETR